MPTLKKILKLMKTPPVVGTLIGLGVFAVVLRLNFTGHFEFLQLKIYDQLLNLQPQDTRAAKQIVVVGIDELDVRAMGRSTITDKTLTKLIDRLGSLGAAAIGLDLFRDQPEGTAADRKNLIAALEKYHVFCVEYPNDLPTLRVPGPREIYIDHPSQIVTCAEPYDDDGEARKADLFVQPSDNLWSAQVAYAQARNRDPGTQSRAYELSLSGAVADYFLSDDPRHKNTPPEWRLKQKPVDKNVSDLAPWLDKVSRINPNDAAYVSSDSSGKEGYQYLLDFKGPVMKLESEAGPENSVRLALRQLLDPGDFPFSRQTQQELDDQAKRNAAVGLPQPAPDLPVNEQRNVIKGKIVLIGQEAVSVKDYASCPRGDYFWGIEYHALEADFLIRAFRGWAHSRQFFNKSEEILWMLGWSFIGVAGGYYFSSLGRLIVLSICATALLGGIVYTAFLHNWWLPALPPAVCFVASAGLMTGYMSQHERGNRLVMNNLFKRMSGDDVVSEVWAKRDEIFEHGRIAPRLVIATMLFIDFEGFSKKTESLKDPKQLTNWLFETMQAMNEVTLKSGGTILRYMGDSFLVAFGAPLYRSNEKEYAADAQSAVKCALAIRGALAALNAKWEKAQQPTLSVRIGICTGDVAAGSIGAGKRMEYTVLGDTVNIASRLENCLKDRMDDAVARDGCRILMSESTYQYCSGMFQTCDLGKVDLRKPTLVQVYAVLGLTSAVNGVAYSLSSPTPEPIHEAT